MTGGGSGDRSADSGDDKDEKQIETRHRDIRMDMDGGIVQASMHRTIALCTLMSLQDPCFAAKSRCDFCVKHEREDVHLPDRGFGGLSP